MRNGKLKMLYVLLSSLLLTSGCGMLFPKPEVTAVSCPGLPPVPLAISEFAPHETNLIDLSATRSMLLLNEMRNEVSKALKQALGLAL